MPLRDVLLTYVRTYVYALHLGCRGVTAQAKPPSGGGGHGRARTDSQIAVVTDTSLRLGRRRVYVHRHTVAETNKYVRTYVRTYVRNSLRNSWLDIRTYFEF